MPPEIHRAITDLSIGAGRVHKRALGHGNLSSVDAARAVVKQIADQTGEPGYGLLLEDALKAMYAQGVKHTADHLAGTNLTESNREGTIIGVIRAEATLDKGEPNYADEAIETARRSRLYQELAERPIWVTDARRMEETVGTTEHGQGGHGYGYVPGQQGRLPDGTEVEI